MQWWSPNILLMMIAEHFCASLLYTHTLYDDYNHKCNDDLGTFLFMNGCKIFVQFLNPQRVFRPTPNDLPPLTGYRWCLSPIKAILMLLGMLSTINWAHGWCLLPINDYWWRGGYNDGSDIYVDDVSDGDDPITKVASSRRGTSLESTEKGKLEQIVFPSPAHGSEVNKVSWT